MTDFQYSGTELEAIAGAKNYYRWIIKQFAPYLGHHVVEVGGGIGTFSEYVLSVEGVESLVAIEPAANVFPILAERFRSDSRVTTVNAYIGDIHLEQVADSLVAVNVIEHIENDGEFLRHAREIVLPGGHLLLFAPALPAIYGTLDRAFEHFRRYSKSALGAVVERSGWEVRELFYVNLLGVLPWLIAGKIFRSTTIGPRQIRVFDKIGVPVISKIESRWEPAFGQSLLLVARNPRTAGNDATSEKSQHAGVPTR
jgi:SAM-dependent methyltransferase